MPHLAWFKEPWPKNWETWALVPSHPTNHKLGDSEPSAPFSELQFEGVGLDGLFSRRGREVWADGIFFIFIHLLGLIIWLIALGEKYPVAKNFEKHCPRWYLQGPFISICPTVYDFLHWPPFIEEVCNKQYFFIFQINQRMASSYNWTSLSTLIGRCLRKISLP